MLQQPINYGFNPRNHVCRNHFLNYWIGIVPVKGVTTLAQMAQAILGSSPLGRIFILRFQLSTALILAVSI